MLQNKLQCYEKKYYSNYKQTLFFTTAQYNDNVFSPIFNVYDRFEHLTVLNKNIGFFINVK